METITIDKLTDYFEKQFNEYVYAGVWNPAYRYLEECVYTCRLPRPDNKSKEHRIFALANEEMWDIFISQRRRRLNIEPPPKHKQ